MCGKTLRNFPLIPENTSSFSSHLVDSLLSPLLGLARAITCPFAPGLLAFLRCIFPHANTSRRRRRRRRRLAEDPLPQQQEQQEAAAAEEEAEPLPRQQQEEEQI